MSEVQREMETVLNQIGEPTAENLLKQLDMPEEQPLEERLDLSPKPRHRPDRLMSLNTLSKLPVTGYHLIEQRLSYLPDNEIGTELHGFETYYLRILAIDEDAQSNCAGREMYVTYRAYCDGTIYPDQDGVEMRHHYQLEDALSHYQSL